MAVVLKTVAAPRQIPQLPQEMGVFPQVLLGATWLEWAENALDLPVAGTIPGTACRYRKPRFQGLPAYPFSALWTPFLAVPESGMIST